MPQMYSIEIRGINELARNLNPRLYDRAIRKGMQRAMTRLTRLYRGRLKAACPVRTGFLKRNIKIQRKRLGRYAYRLEATVKDRRAFYMFILNSGYPRGKHRGWIDRVDRKTQDEVRSIVAEEVGREIRTAISV